MSSSPSSSSYRALVLSSTSKDFSSGIESLELKSLPVKSKLKPNEVRVSISAAAVNFFDLLITTNQYQFKPKLPYTMGNEGSGVVIEVGSSVKHLRVGDEVMAGMSMGGFMADQIVLDAYRVFKKPKELSLIEAAAYPVGFMTAYNGLVQRGNMTEKDSVLITGAAGGMGQSAIQLARAMGVKTIIAGVSSAEKAKAALAMGATHAIDYSKGGDSLREGVKEITGGSMVNIVYEIVGGEIFNQSLRCLAPHGKLLVVGFAGGTIPKMAINLVLLKRIDICGVASGADFQMNPLLLKEIHEKIPSLTKSMKANNLLPQVEVFEADKYKDAFRAVAERKILGKAVIKFGGPTNLSAKL